MDEDRAAVKAQAGAKPAWDKVYEWSSRRGEFQKRAAFSLAAIRIAQRKMSSSSVFCA
jgi:hypothetical protein